jgi:hypothetical protein
MARYGRSFGFCINIPSMKDVDTEGEAYAPDENISWGVLVVRSYLP